jgi:hypothetical protein
MATNGTPHEGTDNILINAYTGLEIILYTNAFNSLDRDTVLADLTQPSALDDASLDNGYAAITLAGVWSSSNSVITYDDGTPDNVLFTNTGTLGSWDTARGSAITDGTYIFHFADFDSEVALPLGATLEIDVSSVVNP